MQNFKFARALLGVVQVAGWVSIAAGVFVAGSGLGMAQGAALIAMGAGAALIGFLLIALAQMSLAVIVTAENTGQMLIEMRAGAQPSVAPAPPAATRPGDVIKTYRGKSIVRRESGVSVGERQFPNVIAAEKWIDGRET